MAFLFKLQRELNSIFVFSSLFIFFQNTKSVVNVAIVIIITNKKKISSQN